MNINNELQREINNGLQFDKYFEKVECKATFEKKGDTTAVLHLMRKHANKYAYQTKAIAPQLKGSTVKQTVENVYNFLYNNVQYQIDGYNQNLRSPACSWQQRKTGIDCKSYSIFASTILQNLGIEHYFRKVKQTYYNPAYWSHVYVVIKDNGKQLVIDPTIHSNNEVSYVQKKDIKVNKLPIYSLNAGVQQPQQPANKRHTEILNGFFEVANLFKKVGIPNSTIQTIQNEVQKNYYKKGSFKFPFKLECNDILVVGNKRIPLKQNLTGLNAGIDLSIFDTGTGGLATTTPVGVSTNSNNSNGAVAGLISTLLDPTGGILTSLLGSLNITENINNVLKYGLDSWGAASSPAKMGNDIKNIYMPLVQQRIDALKTASTPQLFSERLTELDKIIKFYAGYGTASINRRSWAGSTTEAFKLLSKTFSDLYNEVVVKIVQELKSNNTIVNTAQTTANYGDLDQTYKIDIGDDNTTAEKNGAFTYNTYTISGNSQAISNTQNYQTNPDGSPVLDANGNIIPKQKSNVGKIVGYGSAIALAGFLVVPMLNKKK